MTQGPTLSEAGIEKLSALGITTTEALRALALLPEETLVLMGFTPEDVAILRAGGVDVSVVASATVSVAVARTDLTQDLGEAPGRTGARRGVSRLRIQAGRLLRPVFDRTFVEDSASVIMVALLYRTVPQVFDEKFWSDLKLPGSLRALRVKIDGFKLSMRRGEYVLPAELDDIVLAVPDLFHEQFAALMELLHRYTATLKTLQRLGSQATREVNEQDSIDFAGFDRQMARAAKELADKMRASSLPEVSARAVRMINDLLDLLREVVAGLKSLGGTEAAFLSEVEEDDAVVEFLVNRLGESVRDRIVLALLYESAICALAELPQDGEAGEEYLLETGTAFYQLVEQYNLMYPASRQVGPFAGLRVVLSVSASSGGGATATAEVQISHSAPGVHIEQRVGKGGRIVDSPITVDGSVGSYRRLEVSGNAQVGAAFLGDVNGPLVLGPIHSGRGTHIGHEQHITNYESGRAGAPTQTYAQLLRGSIGQEGRKLDLLVQRLAGRDQALLELHALAARLIENRKSERLYGTSETVRSEWSRIIHELIVLTSRELGMPFNDL